jgi:hypothetical protein
LLVDLKVDKKVEMLDLIQEKMKVEQLVETMDSPKAASLVVK